MLLSEAKRLEVREDSAYRGLRLFMPHRDSNTNDSGSTKAVPKSAPPRDRNPNGSTRGPGLRELVLK